MRNIASPPEWAVQMAVEVARESPCSKSKRGVVIYRKGLPEVLSVGFNATPDRSCGKDAACAAVCSKICVHAEMAALRGVAKGDGKLWEMVHVKLGTKDELVSGGGPSCWQCSREIVERRDILSGVWLYETTRDEQCPHFGDLRTQCLYCQGDCCLVHGGLGERTCDCDVLDRHGESPFINAKWHFYHPSDFHRITLENCDIPPIGVPVRRPRPC